MSHPNGEQAEPAYPSAAAGQPPSSFQESATQFAARVTAPQPAPPEVFPPAPAAAPQQAPAVPQQAPAGVFASAPAGAATSAPVDPATQAVYAPGSSPIAAAAPAGPYAQGYGQAANTSAFPVTGVPVSAYPMVMEPKKKRTGMIVLTVVTIVLGLATAGLGTMYLLENGKRTQADTKVSEQSAQLEEADRKIKEIEGKLSTSKEENAKLTQDLTGARNKTDEVAKARDAMAACFQALNEYARNRNATTAKDADTKCAEASKYY
jgi:hypothetical protein